MNDYHFLGGYHLAFHTDSQRYPEEKISFDSMKNNWYNYNENNETEKIAYFVEDKFV